MKADIVKAMQPTIAFFFCPLPDRNSVSSLVKNEWNHQTFSSFRSSMALTAFFFSSVACQQLRFVCGHTNGCPHRGQAFLSFTSSTARRVLDMMQVWNTKTLLDPIKLRCECSISASQSLICMKSCPARGRRKNAILPFYPSSISEILYSQGQEKELPFCPFAPLIFLKSCPARALLPC